ncbi:MAG: hypothetical protein ACRDJC_21405 [Thermomicrobiales bacterium]
MCVLCNQLWIEDHWSEVAADAQPDADDGLMRLEVHVQRRGQRLRDRSERARLVGVILAGLAITLQDWEGSSYILRDAKGKSAVVHDLATVWDEVARMTGSTPDPLDLSFIASLRQRTAMRAAAEK